MRSRLAAVGLLVLLALACAAVWRSANGPPPGRAERVRDVAASLRCPDCQGLSAAESSSELAQAMRAEIGRQVAQGRDADRIREYFVRRYGEWVLLSPPPSGAAMALWVFPGVVLCGGLLAIARAVVRTRHPTARRRTADRRTGRGRTGSARNGRAEVDLTHVTVSCTVGIRTPPGGESPAMCERPRGCQRFRASRRARAGIAGALVLGAVACGGGVLAGVFAHYQASRSSVPPGAASGAGPGGTTTGTGPGGTTSDTGPGATTGGTEPGGTTSDTGPGATTGGTEPGGAAGDPEDPDALLALGRRLDASGRDEDAVDAYRRAVALRPGDPAGRRLLGLALVRTGRPREAVALLRPVAWRFPRDADLLLVLGTAELTVDPPAGRRTLRRFLRIAPPGHPAAGEVRRVVGEAGGEPATRP